MKPVTHVLPFEIYITYLRLLPTEAMFLLHLVGHEYVNRVILHPTILTVLIVHLCRFCHIIKVSENIVRQLFIVIQNLPSFFHNTSDIGGV